MLARMPSSLLSEWMAFYRVCPFGEERQDLRAGMVASRTINIHLAKDSPKVTPREFCLRDLMEDAIEREDAKQQVSWEKDKALCKAFAASFGGRK
jgi:hypothetical protein